MDKLRLMWILWPSFLLAGVLEMIVFALVDPDELHWFGHVLDWPREAVYTAAFFVFWGATASASALTAWLARAPPKHSP